MKKCIVAGVLILSRDGRRTLLIKHKKLGIWVYPGGHIEKGETPLECAIREAKEEAGVDFKVISASGITIRSRVASSLPMPLIVMSEDVPYKTGHHTHFDMIYLGIAKRAKFKPNSESTDCRWFSREAAMRLKTFANVRRIIGYGFERYNELRK